LRRRLLTALALTAAFVPAGTAAASGPDARIVGGHPAPPGAYPWAAALVRSDLPAERGQFCGGSLIGPDLVLTAAHCVAGRAPQDVDVVVGRYRLAERDGERIDAARIASDTRYNPRTSSADAALIRLAGPASQPPVALATAADEPAFAPGRPARVVGWGTLRSGGPEAADVLYEVDVNIDSNAACDEAYAAGGGGAGAIDDTMICASAPGRDACQGDSGGPLMVDEAAGWKQVGIVSFGFGCADPAFPGVYARLPALLDFIQDSDPLWAPRPDKRPRIAGNPEVGRKLHCRKGRWAGDPSFAFGWFRVRDGERRRQISGRQDLRLGERLRGWRVACTAIGFNDGGFAEAESAAVRVAGR
jgi:secreted trypsin-like serine protease